jgi:hypothetical protein
MLFRFDSARRTCGLVGRLAEREAVAALSQNFRNGFTFGEDGMSTTGPYASLATPAS